MIQAYILPLITGAIVGSIFSFMKLPIPAPPTISGILGIVGIYLGYVLVNAFFFKN